MIKQFRDRFQLKLRRPSAVSPLAAGLAIIALLFQLAVAGEHIVHRLSVADTSSQSVLAGIEIPLCQHTDDGGTQDKQAPSYRDDCACCCQNLPIGDEPARAAGGLEISFGEASLLRPAAAIAVLVPAIRGPGQPRAPPLSA